MPLEIIEATDPITALVEFRTSTVYEMLVSLDTLVKARRHLDWVEKAKATLGPDFMAELRELHTGCFLMDVEAAVDYPDHHDVPGFIAYVRNMDPTTFIFYLIGRVVSREQIVKLNMNVDRIMHEVNDYYQGRKHSIEANDYGLREAIANVASFQSRLTALWEHYWNTFFHNEVPPLASRWASAIAEKERVLVRSGGLGLLELVGSKHDKLPEPLPLNRPFTEVIFIPVYFVSTPYFFFYGYGNVTVLFDSERTEARISEANRAKEEALEITKALGDSTRLSILRLIAQNGDEMHGKKIAHHLNLSPSAVSRQLAQLRDGGLLAEEHHDNQTVTYRLIEETLTSLPQKLLDYLYS
jgi:DNA-binding transcriptional ArsR family regulator